MASGAFPDDAPLALREAAPDAEVAFRAPRAMSRRTAAWLYVAGAIVLFGFPLFFLVHGSGVEGVTVSVGGEPVDMGAPLSRSVQLYLASWGLLGAGLVLWPTVQVLRRGPWVALTPRGVVTLRRGGGSVGREWSEFARAERWGIDAVSLSRAGAGAIPGTSRETLVLVHDHPLVVLSYAAARVVPPPVAAPTLPGPRTGLAEDAPSWDHAAEARARERLAAAIGAEAPDFVIATTVAAGPVVAAMYALGALFASLPLLALLAMGAPGSTVTGSAWVPVVILAVLGLAGVGALVMAARLRALVGTWVAGVERGLLVADHEGVRCLPWDRLARVQVAGDGTVWAYKRPAPRGPGKPLGARSRIGLSGRFDARVVAAAIRARLGRRTESAK